MSYVYCLVDSTFAGVNRTLVAVVVIVELHGYGLDTPPNMFFVPTAIGMDD